MAFNDPHAMSLVAPHLFPGEQVLFRARGVEKPFWTLVFSKLGWLFWRYWLVVATNQRLIFVQHGGWLSGYKAKKTETYGWPELDKVALGWGIFNKTLSVRSSSRRVSRSVILPRFWLPKNFDDAQGVVQQWNTGRNALHSVPPASLPPQSYGYPQSAQQQHQGYAT